MKHINLHNYLLQLLNKGNLFICTNTNAPLKRMKDRLSKRDIIFCEKFHTTAYHQNA